MKLCDFQIASAIYFSGCMRAIYCLLVLDCFDKFSITFLIITLALVLKVISIFSLNLCWSFHVSFYFILHCNELNGGKVKLFFFLYKKSYLLAYLTIGKLLINLSILCSLLGIREPKFIS